MKRINSLLVSLLAFTIAVLAGLTFEIHGQIVNVEIKGQNTRFRKSENAIPNRYIVVLNKNTSKDSAESGDTAEELTVQYGGKIDKVFAYAIKGYSVEMSVEDAEKLSEDLRVEYVEEDAEIYANDIQLNADWGLDRMNQRTLPLDTYYSYTSTGSGVHAYVIDSGIRVTHLDFGGRAVADYDVFNDGQNGIDCFGHGTHVAGTIGGSTYGVAKNVTLHAVRVLNCNGSGTFSSLLSGIDWVTLNHISPAVANISISGGGSRTLDSAVKESIVSGVTYAIAAGNNNLNACSYSPGRAPNAITVGATNNLDQRASYSNYGKCVDIFAPGSYITSAWLTNDTATATLSGTSMASPHVAGAAALFLQSNPTASPAMVAEGISDAATIGIILNLNLNHNSVSPNKLLYSLWN